MASAPIGVPLLAAVLVVADPRAVFAYIDPGAGSYITQLIAAAVVSVAFLARMLATRLKATLWKFFSRRRNGEG